MINLGFITSPAACLIRKKDGRKYFPLCSGNACDADEQGTKAQYNFLLVAHKGIKGEKRQEETTQITLLTLNLTKASDFTLDIELFPPLWGGNEEGVCVGEVFTHLWDKHTSQGHEELIPVHWRTANFHCNTKPASCGRGPQKIQIWDSMKGDYSIPKLGLNCKMRCICDLGCCLIPIPLLT